MVPPYDGPCLAGPPPIIAPPADRRVRPMRRLSLAVGSLAIYSAALWGAVRLGNWLRPTGSARAAMEAMPDTAEDELLHTLRFSLKEDQRRTAAAEIVRQGPDAMREMLRDLTEVGDDDSYRFFEPALPAIVAVGPDLLPPLREAMKSKDAIVRAGALMVLHELGPHAEPALDCLADAAGDENRWIRWVSTDSLGRLGPAAAPAVPKLLPLLTHSDALTRQRVMQVLGAIGPEARAAVSALNQAAQVDLDADVRQEATRALYQVNLSAIAASEALRADESIREEITRLSDPNPAVKIEAARALGKNHAWAAHAVGALALALGDENAGVRAAALDALGKIGPRAQCVIPAVERSTHDSARSVRSAAQEALTAIHDIRTP